MVNDRVKRLGVVAFVAAASLGGCCDQVRRELARTQKELTRARDDGRAARAERDQLRAEIETLRDTMKQQKVILELAQKLVGIRGLPLRRPLRVAWVGAETAREHMKQEIAREVTPKFEERYVATLARLGLLPDGYRLLQSLIELMDEQVAGFYDPRIRKLFVRRDMPAGEVILSHEIAHALQDQTYPLKPLFGDRKDHDDRTFAIRALVEGDATSSMVAYLRRGISMWKVIRMLPDLVQAIFMDDARLQAAPAYVRDGVVEPYLKGLEFVQYLRRVGGWARVNRTFRHPPVSSEQILHPHKFLAGEQPVQVSLPDLGKALGLKLDLLHENTLGEFGVSTLLKESAGALLSGRASAGWGGDRLRGYRRPDGRVLLVWRSVWDSRDDALEFVDGMLVHLDHRYGPGRSRRVWRTRGGVAVLRTRGREVLLVDGARDLAQANAIERACALGPKGR